LVDSFLPDQLGLGSKIVVFIMVCFPITIGFPILKSANLGVAPNDAIYLGIADKLNKPYRTVRMFIDAGFILVGVGLGGVAGIGTIICVNVLGPLTQYFFSIVDQVVKKFFTAEGIRTI
jgi:uncharacterized protein